MSGNAKMAVSKYRPVSLDVREHTFYEFLLFFHSVFFKYLETTYLTFQRKLGNFETNYKALKNLFELSPFYVFVFEQELQNFNVLLI